MSVQTALRFIQSVGEDEALRGKVRALGREADLGSLVQIGMEAGFAFTAEELRAAFERDWAIRWVFYSSHRLGLAGRLPSRRRVRLRW
jgi:predicted ribosomally synthesized peptide with nif11-like leader